jgi:hypothetical protein
MNGIDAQIFKREISSLKAAIAFRLLSWGYLAGIEPFSAKSLMELVFVELLMLFGIAISSYRRYGQYCEQAGNGHEGIEKTDSIFPGSKKPNRRGHRDDLAWFDRDSWAWEADAGIFRMKNMVANQGKIGTVLPLISVYGRSGN